VLTTMQLAENDTMPAPDFSARLVFKDTDLRQDTKRNTPAAGSSRGAINESLTLAD